MVWNVNILGKLDGLEVGAIVGSSEEVALSQTAQCPVLQVLPLFPKHWSDG